MRIPLAVFLLAMAAGAAEFADDFSAGLAQWEPLLADHWEIRAEEGNQRLVLAKPGSQRPPVRRPGQFALLKGAPWWDVTVDVSVKTLRPDRVKGRDVCVIFGRRDDTHFYYAHLCSESNGSAHNVLMKVAGTKRRVIMREKRPEARLTAAWHRVRVTHRSNGEIRVCMDDMETPLMTAEDRDYPVGQIGLGAFDDPAMFDDVRIAGQRLDEAATTVELVEPWPGAKLADSTPRFGWRGADSVTVEVSETPDFGNPQAVVAKGHLLSWPTPLDPGTWYWRIALAGEPRSFVQTAPVDLDRQDPRLVVADASLSAQAPLPVFPAPGETTVGMHVEATVNALAATVVLTGDGWSVLPPKGWAPGRNEAIIRAVDPAGNAAEFRAVVKGH